MGWLHTADRSSVGLAGRLSGAGLLLAAGGIHLDLYLTGYRTIPTIGPLFLLQVVAAFLLAAGIIVTSNWFITALGSGFAMATLGGYVLSIWVGLFGFTEVRTTAGVWAGSLEVAAFGVLAPTALAAFTTALHRGGGTGASRRLMVAARAVVAAIFLLAAALLATALASAPSPSPTGNGRGHVRLGTRQVGGTLVLADPRGLTLYWFAIDTPTQSRCYGSCAVLWPPVLGRPVAGRGVTGRLGTIRRSDGALQATYDGHPLYTYAGDSPGTARGNGLNLNGGLWHEVMISPSPRGPRP